MQKMRYTLLAGTTVVLATVGLSACGGSTNTPATPTATTSGAPSAPSNGAAAARGARARLFADPKVQQCLDAAGMPPPARQSSWRSCTPRVWWCAPASPPVTPPPWWG